MTGMGNVQHGRIMQFRLCLTTATVILFAASPCLCQGTGGKGAPGPAVLLSGDGGTGNTSVYKANVIVRAWGDDLIPFNVTKQGGIIKALEAIMFPQSGPVKFVAYGEYPAGTGDANETSPYVDLAVLVYIRLNDTQIAYWTAVQDYDSILKSLGAAFPAFQKTVIYINLAGGLSLKARLLRFSGQHSDVDEDSLVLLPVQPYNLALTVVGEELFDADSDFFSQVLTAVRLLLADVYGQQEPGSNMDVTSFVSYIELTDWHRNNSTKDALVTLTVYATQCYPGERPDVEQQTCFWDPAEELQKSIQQANLVDYLQEQTGLNISNATASVVPRASPQIATTAAKGALAPPSDEYLVPANKTPWHLDRIDQRELPLDGAYTSPNIGEGVNIYLLSSGVLASHEEFFDPGRGISRIAPLWGTAGLDPLTDCKNAPNYYGYGTYAASIIAGRRYGVAKNATIHSVRFRESCLSEDPSLWERGGLPSGIDAIISNPQLPAIIVIDTTWSPGRNSFDSDAFVSSAITQRLNLALAANITVIAPSTNGQVEPCNNIFAAHPGVISVSSSDDKDRPTIFARLDTGNTSCIDFFAPGGGLGSAVVGASPTANDSYIGVAVQETGAFLAAGVAAQYLSLHPHASPAQVREALIAMTTKDVLVGLEGPAPNRLLFTSLEPKPEPSSGSSGGGSSLSAGAIAGIAIGGAALLAACIGCIFLGVLYHKKATRLRVAKEKQAALEARMDAELVKAGLPPLKELGGDLNEWQLDANDVKICKNPDGSDVELGHGSFGRVVLGKRGIQDVAIKVTIRQDDSRLMERFVQEIAIMRYLSRDKNIVQFYGAVVRQPSELWLVLEYMEGGDLRRALSDDRTGSLLWYNKGKRILLDVARGLTFCHEQRNGPIAHRDLKSKNILLSKEGLAKISDMGLCREVVASTLQTHTDTIYGTFAWAAPELLLGEKCTEKADIYSLGVVIWEVCTQEVPIRGALRAVRVPEECPQEVADLIDDCLERSPDARPSAREVFRRIDASPPCEGGLPEPKLQDEDDSLHDSVESTGTLGPVNRMSPPAVS